MPRLQIYRPGERFLVGAADLALRPLRWFRRVPERAGRVDRVLLLRLERIGDLLMTLGAIRRARTIWPGATIDLAVGSWNEPLARLIPGVSRVLVADPPWLARDGAGDTWPALIGRARRWRRHRYDVVVNFEPDIRSNILAWVTGAQRRIGFWTGGGGALLTDALAFDPTVHVADNAARLLEGPPAASPIRLMVPASARSTAARLLDGASAPLIGIHASGGRESKQWHLERFADVGRQLAAEFGATIVLTGSAEDAPKVAAVARGLADAATPTINAQGALELVDLAALLERLDLFITGDTGPMHLAAAVGTPVVALFGPSDPRRYGPLIDRQRIVRIDLPCAPCGQVRLPPERCRGHVPDCMDGITSAAVISAARELLAVPSSRDNQPA
jgi:ADP-heptose:LPS heptosyltransferase